MLKLSIHIIFTYSGWASFLSVAYKPIIQPVNAIKKELELFYKSITENFPLAVSLLDAEVALQVVREIEVQINPR